MHCCSMISQSLLGLLVTAVVLLSFLLFKKILVWVRMWKVISGLPGPKGVPILGNGLSMIGDSEHIYNILTDWGLKYTRILKIWIGPTPMVLINDPADIKFVLNHPDALHKGYQQIKAVKPVSGDGLLLAHPQKWKSRRTLVGATFSKTILNSYVPIMEKQCKVMEECLKPHLDGPSVDLASFTYKASLDTILGTAMGVELDCQNKGNNYMSTANEILRLMAERIFKFWLLFDWIYRRSKLGQRMTKLCKSMQDFSWNVLTQRKLKHFENEEATNDGCEKRLKPKTTIELFLDLSQTDPMFTQQELICEVNTLILAGYETTAVSSAFTLLMLAIHPDIQELVYKEIWDLFGNSSRDITIEDLRNLRYLEMVIKETLRMFPPVAIFQRQSVTDLAIGDYYIPKGIPITVWIPAVHRNEIYWPNPSQFDPMRFTPENIAKRHPYCFIPFSAGPRNCIGLSYAYQFLKIQIVSLLRSYRFSTPLKLEDVRLAFTISLHPVNGYPVQIHKR